MKLDMDMNFFNYWDPFIYIHRFPYSLFVGARTFVISQMGHR
jgi:hypothetical protein